MLKIATGCSWAVLSILSLVPGRYRPHTGLPHPVELIVAFFLVGLLTRFTLQDTRSRWQVLAFVVVAALFQVSQAWIPGRSARLSDWAISSTGAFLGVLLAKVVLEPGVFGLG